MNDKKKIIMIGCSVYVTSKPSQLKKISEVSFHNKKQTKTGVNININVKAIIDVPKVTKTLMNA